MAKRRSIAQQQAEIFRQWREALNSDDPLSTRSLRARLCGRSFPRSARARSRERGVAALNQVFTLVMGQHAQPTLEISKKSFASRRERARPVRRREKSLSLHHRFPPSASCHTSRSKTHGAPSFYFR